MTRPQSNRSAAGTMEKKERMGYDAILANPHPKSITRKSEIFGGGDSQIPPEKMKDRVLVIHDICFNV
jgi:hypothetical protein